MTFYVCSCGLLFGEKPEAFDQFCKLKGHSLIEVNVELYAIMYAMYERTIKLKETVHKRNCDIARLRDKLQKNHIELHVLKRV